MIPHALSAAAAAVLFAGAAGPLHAQQPGDASVQFRVTDARTSEPLAGVQVTLPDLYRFWITDAAGIASVTGIPPGRHRFELTRDRFAGEAIVLELEPAAMAEAEVSLAWEGQALEPLQILSSGSTGSGDAALLVRVTDAFTGDPIEGARVTFSDISRSWITDASGRVTASPIPAGEQQVEIERVGFGAVRARLTFQPGALAEAGVQMQAQAIELPGVEVRIRADAPREGRLERAGFYQRERMGIGHHLDRVEIESKNPVQPSDLFRGMPGVRLVPVGHGKFAVESRRPCGGFRASGPMRIYLDGIRFDGLVDDLTTEWFAAVEVYAGSSQIPGQSLGVAESCGVILLWTR